MRFAVPAIVMLASCGDNAATAIDAPMSSDVPPVDAAIDAPDAGPIGPCLTASTDLSIEIPRGLVAGAFTIDGAAPPDGAKLFMIGAGSDVFPISSQGAIAAIALPGVYDIYYASSIFDPTGAHGQPANSAVRVRQGVSIPKTFGTTPMQLDVDVVSTTVGGTLTIDGVAATAGKLTFRSATGDSAPVWVDASGAFSTKILPGTYDVYYASFGAGPRNTNVRVQTAVAITAPATVAIDLHAATISGTLALDGNVVPSGASVTLRSSTGDFATLPLAVDRQSFSGVVLTGNYDVYYTGSLGANGTLSAKVGTATVAAPSTTKDLAITTIPISGTVNADNGTLSFFQHGGAETTLRATGAPSTTYTGRLVADTYDVTYAVTNRTGPGPVNEHAVIEQNVILDGTAQVHDLALAIAHVSGTAGYIMGVTGFEMRFTVGGDRALGVVQPNGTYAFAAIPKSYDVRLVRDGNPEFASFEIAKGFALAGTTTLDAIVDAATTNVTVTRDGAPAGTGIRILFENAHHRVQAVTANVNGVDGAFTTALPPGGYDMYLTGSLGAGVPMNVHGKLGCLEIVKN